MSKRSKGHAVEVTCWTLGVVLTAFYVGARAYGELERQQAITAFAEARLSVGGEPSPVGLGNPVGDALLTSAHIPDQAQWSASRIRAHAALAANTEFELPAAILRVSRLNLEVPVYTDTSERNLNRGAGLIEGTARPGDRGNVAIAAHRDGYFRALAGAALGDVIELESLTQHASYRVTELAVVEPTDLWPLDETDMPSITLVTCYPFYFVGRAPQRFIVRAVAVD